MSEKQHSIYLSQLKAMLKRNILLKKRQKRKSTAVSNTILQCGIFVIIYSCQK